MDADYKDKLTRIMDQPEEEVVSNDPYITLSTGVVLKAHPVPIGMLTTTTEEFAIPDPPRVYIESKNRYEINYHDPEYKKVVDRIEEERGKAVLDVFMGMGTSVEHVPDGIPGPDDDDWIEDAEFFFRMQIPQSKKVRYLFWLKFVAAPSISDLGAVSTAVQRQMGVTEGGVIEKMGNFRGS